MKFICALCKQQSTELGREFKTGEKICKKCNHHQKYLDKVMRSFVKN